MRDVMALAGARAGGRRAGGRPGAPPPRTSVSGVSGALAIETRSLRRTFKGGVEAVRGVDLSVANGEMFGFLGPNGAGKTTMVRMLCTLLPPTDGSASVTTS